MAAASKPSTPSILPELQKFVANIGRDVPYNQLLQTAAEAGWGYQLHQHEFFHTTDGLCITFEVSVGKIGSPYEHFDYLTFRMGTGPGPVSTVARTMAQQSLVHLFFGRLPPPVPPVAAPAPIDMKDQDVVLPGEQPVPEQEYVGDEPAEIEVVARREPDGLPIFADLTVLGPDTRAIIDAVLDEISGFCDTASLEQVNALPIKNPGMIAFMSDLGTDDERAEMRAIVDKRRNFLTPPVSAVPRRRRAGSGSV